MNAREEFLEHISGNRVKCAEIGIDFNFASKVHYCESIVNLKIGYTESDFNKFLSDINVEYNAGYGTQFLFGTIWYEDGTWSEREERNGSEWWCNKSVPDIPDYLLNK